MRWIKKAAVCFLTAATAAVLAGCWNNRPITNLAIVAGMGFDLADDGGVQLTAQIVIPSLLGQTVSGAGSGNNSGNAGVNVTVEGETTFDAVRNLLKKVDRKAYFGHVQLLVFGEKMAREGIDETWDFLERDNEFSRVMRVMVVQGGTAKSLLEAEPDLGKLNALEVEITVSNGTNLGKSIEIKSFEITQLLSESNTGIVTGAAQVGGATKLTDVPIQGAAVFKHAKLVGYLDPEQARGYLFAQNQIQSTILVVKNPAEPDKKISLEVIRSSGRMQAEIAGGRPRLDIRVDVEGNMGEQEGAEDLYTEKYIPKIESEAEELVRGNIQSAVEASRQMSCDIFGMNTMLGRTSSAAFKKLRSQWDTVYPAADFEVKVQFHLKRPGLITRPALRE